MTSPDDNRPADLTPADGQEPDRAAEYERTRRQRLEAEAADADA